MLSGMIVGIIWMVLGFSDKIEAIYPVVLVTYFIGIIVSLVTNKKGEELAWKVIKKYTCGHLHGKNQ